MQGSNAVRKYINKLLAYFGYLHIDEVNEILSGEVAPIRARLLESDTTVLTLFTMKEITVEALKDIREHQNKTGKSEGYVAKRALLALNELKR
jgi:hypothetical protein